jgi:hypothetical protein
VLAAARLKQTVLATETAWVSRTTNRERHGLRDEDTRHRARGEGAQPLGRGPAANRHARVQGASKIAGREPVSGWIALILYLLLSPGMFAYLQVSLNNVWEQEAEALPGQSAPPAPADEMPPRL